MKKLFRKKIIRNLPQAGFTILVAVVTASILLIIAMSIGGIALKEQVLSGSGKESQIAFYAADTGMECALFWDMKGNVSAFVPDASGNLQDQTINCNGAPITAKYLPIDGTSKYSYSFMENNLTSDSNMACAQVIVTKTKYSGTVDNDGNTVAPNKIYTTINAYGYNTCAASFNRMERGILANY